MVADRAVKKRLAIGLAAAWGLSAASADAQEAVTPGAPIEADWRDIPAEDLLVMALSGNRQIVVRLAPTYAPEHVANVRRLAVARWWDGLSVYRVQDNWVAQWGDASEKKALPSGVTPRPDAEYDLPQAVIAQPLARSDAYSARSGFSQDGWALAGNGQAVWMAHCYGTVGVARNDAPDTGSGSELFVAIGGSARRLDRNYTVVGRVIDGMHLLSALPRSLAKMGVYARESERTPIVTVRLASELADGERPHWQYRAPDNPRFAAVVADRADPAPPRVGLQGIDVCDVPLEVRKRPG